MEKEQKQHNWLDFIDEGDDKDNSEFDKFLNMNVNGGTQGFCFNYGDTIQNELAAPTIDFNLSPYNSFGNNKSLEMSRGSSAGHSCDNAKMQEEFLDLKYSKVCRDYRLSSEEILQKELEESAENASGEVPNSYSNWNTSTKDHSIRHQREFTPGANTSTSLLP